MSLVGVGHSMTGNDKIVAYPLVQTELFRARLLRGRSRYLSAENVTRNTPPNVDLWGEWLYAVCNGATGLFVPQNLPSFTTSRVSLRGFSQPDSFRENEP